MLQSNKKNIPLGVLVLDAFKLRSSSGNLFSRLDKKELVSCSILLHRYPRWCRISSINSNSQNPVAVVRNITNRRRLRLSPEILQKRNPLSSSRQEHHQPRPTTEMIPKNPSLSNTPPWLQKDVSVTKCCWDPRRGHIPNFPPDRQALIKNCNDEDFQQNDTTTYR